MKKKKSKKAKKIQNDAPKKTLDNNLSGPVNTNISQVLPEGTYTGKEYIQFLKDSGIGDSVAVPLPTFQEQQMARAWWDNIQMQSNLDRSGRRERISKEEKKFLKIKDKLPADALTGKLDVFIIYIEEYGLKISRSTAHKIWKKYRSS